MTRRRHTVCKAGAAVRLHGYAPARVERVERSRKGRRVRVRAVADGRAVQCCNAWRERVAAGGEPVAILARDAGAHWRMVGAP